MNRARVFGSVRFAATDRNTFRVDEYLGRIRYRQRRYLVGRRRRASAIEWYRCLRCVVEFIVPSEIERAAKVGG